MGNYNRNAINYAKQYLKKGSQVYVEGKLETNKWQDQNGIVKAEGGSNIKRGYIDLMKNFKNNISIGVNHD